MPKKKTTAPAQAERHADVVEFRRRLEAALEPALADMGDEVVELARDLIDALCAAYVEGGLIEARRCLRQLKDMMNRGNREAEQVEPRAT